METLLSIAIALCAGLLVSRFVKPLKLPAVTGYLIAGILIGPYCLGKLGVQGLGFPTNGDVKALSLFNDVALGFIAFAIGNEFRLSQLRHTGKQATVIGIFQALTATLMVDLVLIGLHIFVLGDSMSLADAIVLGAIATATAPAATLMVVRQYKAKGELTDLLLPIVALDDAVGLIVFAISFGVAKAINYGHYDMTSILVEPLLEIVLSILLGFVMGSMKMIAAVLIGAFAWQESLWVLALTAVCLLLYDGYRGRSRFRSFFYIYYPAHLLVLYFLS